MKRIDADVFSKEMQNFFVEQIEKGNQVIDVVDCNARLQKILKEQRVVNEWILCEERYPDNGDYILLSFANFSIPVVGRYEENADGGAFYVGDEEESCVSQGMYVNAWQQLPSPYKPIETEKESQSK